MFRNRVSFWGFRNRVSFWGFRNRVSFWQKQLTVITTTETRFLFSTRNPVSFLHEKPGFFSPPQKPGFFLRFRNRVSFWQKQLTVISTTETRFLFSTTETSRIIFMVRQTGFRQLGWAGVVRSQFRPVRSR